MNIRVINLWKKIKEAEEQLESLKEDLFLDAPRGEYTLAVSDTPGNHIAVYLDCADRSGKEPLYYTKSLLVDRDLFFAFRGGQSVLSAFVKKLKAIPWERALLYEANEASEIFDDRDMGGQ